MTAQDAPIRIAWCDTGGIRWSALASTGNNPPGIRAVLSDDGGRTWRLDEELRVYDRQGDGSKSGMGGARDFGDYWSNMSV